MTLGDLKQGDKFRWVDNDKSKAIDDKIHSVTATGTVLSLADDKNWYNNGLGVEKVEACAKASGDPRFHALLKQIGDLHSNKAADYGTSDDPYANIRASSDLGVAPWVGACLRGFDKVQRIKSFVKNGNLVNESVEDSLLDLAAYSLIALILYREEHGCSTTTTTRSA